mmetsp:Transcript_26807/g.78981  ORF Transcript_26807/g.78981 Transcript_26807/m.78981 type:complete len:87 (-) Transcript_26807:6579-6839(-)
MTRPAFSSLMSFHMRRFVWGSRPVVGSSRKITGGDPTREIATETRRFCPPESVPASASSFSERSTALTMRSDSRFMSTAGTPRTLL